MKNDSRQTPGPDRRQVLSGLTAAAAAATAGAAVAKPSADGAPPLATLTASEALAGMASGALTAEGLMRAVQERIAALEPAYNAFVHLDPGALEAARRIDQDRAAGRPLGPLAGLPLAVKDSVDAAGAPTTCCWAPLNPANGGYGLIPTRDATALARLRAAGAILVGKTNTPAFSAADNANTSWAGPTYNAVDRRLTPSGSSSGSATAVAAGMALLSVAEESGGSIENPAGVQSIVAVKPSFGLIPNSGLAPLASSTIDVLGPHVRSVRDAALMLDVMAGYSVEDPKTLACLGRMPVGGYGAGLRADGLTGRRLGTFGPGWRSDGLSSETDTAYRRALGQVAGLGAALIDDPFSGTAMASLAQPEPGLGAIDLRGLESMAYDWSQYLGRNPAFGVATFAELLAKAGADPFAQGQPLVFLRGYLERTGGLRPETPDLAGFIAAKTRYLALLDEVFTAHRLDGLVFPQMMAAPPALHGEGHTRATAVHVINIAGLPGVVVPAGRLSGGAPFALIFLGRPFSEASLLSMAHAYEQAFPGRITPQLKT